MSSTTEECGCEGEDVYPSACRFPALEAAAKRAAAELRHAHGNASRNGGRVDLGLVSRAIQLLEEATTPGRKP